MKKMMALLLAAVMVLALTACGEKKPDESGDPPSGSQSGSTPVVDPVTPPAKDDWGVEDNMASENKDYMTARYYISYPHYVGVRQRTGYMAEQGDGTMVLADDQAADSVVPNGVSDVFPAWFEQEVKNLKEYYGITCKDYKFELESQSEVTVNGKKMAKFEGNLTYSTYENVPKAHQWVAYSVQTEKNGAYACWMVLDISDDQSKAKLIEEHALNMAKSFYEE